MSYTLPAVGVEIGFDDGGVRQNMGRDYDAIEWTDVTDYVYAAQGLSFNRGRSQPGEAAAAGQLSVTFDNTDGRFTPGRSGGAYGAIHTRMPVRVVLYPLDGVGTGPFSAEFGETWFDSVVVSAVPVWTGFVTDWSWVVESGQALARLEASDIIAAAARTRLRPWMTSRIQTTSDDLIAYWPLTDIASNATAQTVGGTGASAAAAIDDIVVSGIDELPDLRVAGSSTATSTIDLGVTSDLSPDPGQSVVAFTPTSATDAKWLQCDRLRIDASGDLAISAWVRPSELPASVITMARYNDLVAGVAVDGSGQVAVYEYNDAAATTSGTYGASGLIAISTWTHIYVERDHSRTTQFDDRWRVWVNGTERTLASGGASVSAADQVTVDVALGLLVTPLSGQMGHVAIYGSLSGDARAGYLAGNGTLTPSASYRFSDLPNTTGLAATLGSWLTSDATATRRMSAQSTKDKTLIASAQEIADAECGALIASASGKLELVSQLGRIAPTTASLTISAESDLLSLDGAFGVDDATHYSQATITMQPSGIAVTRPRVTDPGLEAYAADLWVVDRNVASALAAYVANADPDTARAPSLALSMDWATFNESVDDIISLDLGDMVTITDLPASAPDTSVDLIVESIRHTIASSGWTVELDTSPPVYGFVLDDAARGLLTTATCLLGV